MVLLLDECSRVRMDLRRQVKVVRAEAVLLAAESRRNQMSLLRTIAAMRKTMLAMNAVLGRRKEVEAGANVLRTNMLLFPKTGV